MTKIINTDDGPVELVTIKSGAAPGREILHVVRFQGKEIGMLTKFKDTRTETNPWKAWTGIGQSANYEESFYGEHGAFNALALVVRMHKAAEGAKVPPSRVQIEYMARHGAGK